MDGGIAQRSVGQVPALRRAPVDAASDKKAYVLGDDPLRFFFIGSDPTGLYLRAPDGGYTLYYYDRHQCCDLVRFDCTWTNVEGETFYDVAPEELERVGEMLRQDGHDMRGP